MDNNNNMEKWAVSGAKNHVSYVCISYQCNITWLNVIIVKEYLSGL